MIRLILAAIFTINTAMAQCYPNHPVGATSTVPVPSPGCNEIGGAQTPFLYVDFVQPPMGVQVPGTTGPGCMFVVPPGVVNTSCFLPTLVSSCLFCNQGFIPPIPWLQGVTFYAQGALFDGVVGNWAVTTPFAFTIQP